MNVHHVLSSQKVCISLLKCKELGYSNIYELPKLKKIVINRGVGDASQTPQILNNLVFELNQISGQKSIITKAKKAISSFKLRPKMPVGIYVTLRGQYMYNFLDRLINLALPRIRDFQGLKITSFDGFGNYTFGLNEQLMFPEMHYDQIDGLRGMDITIVTSAKTDNEAYFLLKQYGFPFKNKS
uniref:Large ribosomal subunit protein uL5c n=1 Tax=Pedobesia claviformis TaxID=2364088 RepID=A0A386B0S8_9CHLO|nr:ribosomal protein L5 [Pedobesia claviformis]AYC65301.1 ribosomal protein L5 [Pedobesia claviformis]